MVRIITDYLDLSAAKYPDKVAVTDEMCEMTFLDIQSEAKKIATDIIHNNIFKKSILVFMDKSPRCVAVFMGVAYSGNFYTPMDTTMPISRIYNIIEILQPDVIIIDDKYVNILENDKIKGIKIIKYSSIHSIQIDELALKKVHNRIIDTDILYVLFTSGSTGVPKGVIVSHRSVINHAEWAANAFSFDNNNIFANQSPFYFDHSILELFQTIRNGATLHIVPTKLFSFPKKLMYFLAEKKIDTIIWVPSALCYLANLGAVDKYFLPALKNILFGGEVMPVKQLNIWRKVYPNNLFVNLYGPTEATDDSTYFIVNRNFSEEESLPIGKHCENTDVFILNERDELITDIDEVGELCIRGTSVAYGYYRNPEKTKMSFVQNPLNDIYEEKIYRTGDLVKYNSNDEIVYICRKDYQIKHNGRRIELGEIDTVASSYSGIDRCSAIYDEKNKQIVLYYSGECNIDDLSIFLKANIPSYMLPNKFIKVKEMPLSNNGKIDRIKLKEML